MNFYTADLHLGHRLVAEHRGFSSTTEHDDAITEMWNAKVKHPDDIVFVLGDLTMGNPKGWIDFVRNLNGRKHFISGNHDNVHPMHRDSQKHQRTYLDMFESVAPFARRRIDGIEVLLSHFPYSADRDEQRYSQYRLKDEGKWLLHGHTHSADIKTSDHEIHVGLDAWGLSPVSEAVIARWLVDG